MPGRVSTSERPVSKSKLITQQPRVGANLSADQSVNKLLCFRFGIGVAQVCGWRLKCTRNFFFFPILAIAPLKICFKIIRTIKLSGLGKSAN